MMGKTLALKAGELEAELKKEMAALYVKMKGSITDDQKVRVRTRLSELEALITGHQDACAPCTGSGIFGKKKAQGRPS